ncbi:unnamed protein product [Debaryomyces tyrocola]|nr:unnamed protein product [Debaryomyces tyrocola]
MLLLDWPSGPSDAYIEYREKISEEKWVKEKWVKEKVHTFIKSRLEKLHLLRVSHNDVRSGKISLINIRLSACTNNEDRKNMTANLLTTS